MKTYDVYLASPFFTPAQIERIEKVENLLDKLGLKYFSPRKELVCPPEATREQRQETFNGNIRSIENSTITIFISDDKDMGTIFEAGFAYAIKKPLIGVAFTLGNAPFNLMLSESCKAVCKTIEDLEDILVNNKSVYYQGIIE